MPTPITEDELAGLKYYRTTMAVKAAIKAIQSGDLLGDIKGEPAWLVFWEWRHNNHLRIVPADVDATPELISSIHEEIEFDLRTQDMPQVSFDRCVRRGCYADH